MHSKFIYKNCIEAAITILTGHTSATSLASYEMADTVKLAFLTNKVLHTGTLSYLSERLHPYIPSRTLRLSSSANLYVPRTNLHFGSRSFHIAAPIVWNSLPSTLHLSQTLNTLKTS